MSSYSFLLKRYPAYVTKEQVYKICHISKNTARYYLENGFIPCSNSGKKTRRYKITMKDIIFFLEDREKNPEKYYLPNHYNNPFLPEGIGWHKGKTQNCKLKGMDDVKDYIQYLELQFSDYPDMLTGKQIHQITGYPTETILSWCKSGKVRYIKHHNTYLLQKKSVIYYLFFVADTSTKRLK